MKRKKLRKLIQQEIKASRRKEPVYWQDTELESKLSELLNITKESVARSGEYSFNVTAWNQLAGEETPGE